jgi:hypothetical protein
MGTSDVITATASAVTRAGSGPSELGAAAMAVGLTLAVALAYLLAHFVVGRLERRFLVLSGPEYVLLGVLLGPAVPALRVLDHLAPLMPVIALAVGWVGLLRGMELGRARDEPPPAHRARLTLLTSGAAALAVALVLGWVLQAPSLASLPPRELWVSAGMLACVAASGSLGPLNVLAERYALEGSTPALLARAMRLGDVAALVAFGLLFCVFHADDPRAPLALRPTEWAVISVLLGAALGLLFRVFLGPDDTDHGRFLAMVGIITFAAGAAYMLSLSPLLVTVVLGAVLVSSPHGAAVRATLERTERPMSLLLRVFAGALWVPVPALVLGVGVLSFVCVRVLAKAAGSALAAWGLPLRSDLYRGLLGHADVTVAMAISFRLVYSGPVADVAYAIALGSVVVSDLLATRVLRGLLVDAGSLRRERPVAAALAAPEEQVS